MKSNPYRLFARTTQAGIQTLALSALLAAGAHAGIDVYWDAGDLETGTDWSLGENWDIDEVPTSADIAIFDTPTEGQPNLTVSSNVGGVNFHTGDIAEWTLSADPGATLNLGAAGIDAIGFADGTINFGIPTKLVSASASTWSIFDSTAGLTGAPVFNISGSIQIHPTATLNINALRASTSTVGTINLTAPVTGSGTGTVKFTGSNIGKNTINIIGASSDYAAPTSITTVNLNYDQLADEGTNSSFGSSGIINIGEGASATAVNYVGTSAASTDRRITFGLTIGKSTGFKLANNSPTTGDAGAINFNSTASILSSSADGKSDRTVLLGGTQNGANSFAGLIEDNGSNPTSFSKTDAGYWILTNTNNSFTGGVTMISGTLGISADGVLGVAGGNINFTGHSNLVATGDATLSAARTVTVSASKTGQFGITSAAGTTFIVDAKITGPGNVSRQSGSAFTTGAVRFTNDANDYTGVFDTRAAFTEFTSITNPGLPSALGAGTQINSVNGASFTVLSYVGSTDSTTTRPIVWSGTSGDLHLASNGSGTVSYLNTTPVMTSNGSKTLVLRGLNTGANVFAQPLNDPSTGQASLQKFEAGNWILTAVNNFTGIARIDDGTLTLGKSASIASASDIALGTGTLPATGATLDISAKTAPFAIPAAQSLSGVGSVIGQSLNIAGRVAPGTSTQTGTLSTAGVSFQSGAMLDVRVDSSEASVDSLAVTGNLTIGANVTLNVSDPNTTQQAIGAKLTIASYTGTLSGTFQGLPEGSIITVGPNDFTLSYNDGNAITLTSSTPYTDWIDSFTSLSGAQKDKTADPDSDGMNNQEEFAFDGNPASGVNSGKVQSSIATIGGKDYLTISFPVRSGANFSGSPLASAQVDGVAYTVLGSHDLATFTDNVVEVAPAVVSTPALSSGWVYKTFRLGQDTGVQPRGFLRIMTEGPTP